MAHSEALMKVLVDLATGPETPASTRAQVGMFVYDQLTGKAKQRMTIDGELSPRGKTMTALVPAILLNDGLPQDLRHLTPERRRQLRQSLDGIDGQPVWDGEVVDDDEEEYDPGDALTSGVDDEEDRMPQPLREADDEGRIL